MEQEVVEEPMEDDDDKDGSSRTTTTMMDTNSYFGLSRPLLLPKSNRNWQQYQPVAPILVYSSNLSNQSHSQCLKASDIWKIRKPRKFPVDLRSMCRIFPLLPNITLHPPPWHWHQSAVHPGKKARRRFIIRDGGRKWWNDHDWLQEKIVEGNENLCPLILK